MPVIFRAICTNCGETPEVNRSVDGTATAPGRKEGESLREGFLALKLDNGKFVVLSHPLEQRHLKEHGFTWSQAARQSRLFSVQRKICERCGLICEEYQHGRSHGGCLVAVLAVPVMAGLLKYGAKASWLTALFGAYLGMLAVFGSLELLGRARWRERNAKLKLRECPACRGTKFLPVSKAAGKFMMCPRCHTQNMRYDVAGIS